MARHEYPHGIHFKTTYKMHNELRHISQITNISQGELIREAIQNSIDEWNRALNTMKSEENNVAGRTGGIT